MENRCFGKSTGSRLIPNTVRKVIRRLPDEFTRNDIVSLLNISKSQARLYAEHAFRYKFIEKLGLKPGSRLIIYRKII